MSFSKTSLIYQPISSHTHSVETAQQCLDEIIGPHELIDLYHEQPLNFSFQGERIGGIIIGDLIYGKEVIFKTQNHIDMHFYCITRPKIGQSLFKQEQHSFLATTQNAAIVSPFDKFEIEIDQECIQNFISISKPLLESVLIDLIKRPLDQPLHFQNTMYGENPKIKAWWELADYLCSYSKLNFNFDCLMPDIKNDFEKILVKALLLSQPHNYSDLLYENQDNNPEYLKRALQFIQHNIQTSICHSDLEHITGVSKQKLSKAFKLRLQMSPHSYIRYYRLKCIYEELSLAKDKTNITAIAMKWGISHLGRFSIEYKQQFGESPSDTIRKSILQKA